MSTYEVRITFENQKPSIAGSSWKTNLRAPGWKISFFTHTPSSRSLIQDYLIYNVSELLLPGSSFWYFEGVSCLEEEKSNTHSL